VHGEIGKGRAQHAKLTVLRPEVVAPLTDAMRLVDGEEGRVGAPQALGEAFHHEAFGRDIQQMQTPGGERGEHICTFPRRLAAVEVGRRHARLTQTVDLVLHERD
jgi:hypothetical protein